MPSDQLFEAFLELSLATGTSDPAPFRWKEWKETVVDIVPPWSLAATATNTTLPRSTVNTIRAFAHGYYAQPDARRRDEYSCARGTHNNSNGRENMLQYLKDQWPKWKVNEVIDEVLKSVGVDLYHMTTPDMENVGTHSVLTRMTL